MNVRAMQLRSAAAGWLCGFVTALCFSWFWTNVYEALFVLMGGIALTFMLFVAHGKPVDAENQKDRP